MPGITVREEPRGTTGARRAGGMRAMRLAGPRRVELVDVPRPEPADGEVRVRVAGCGVCGSNLPVWEGRPWFEYPLGAGSPGHEGWGVVDAVGAGVTGLHAGDAVAMLSYRAFAEYDIANSDDVIPLPAAVAERPFPAEPLACAINVVARAGIQPGERVAVIGIGFLGAVVVQLAAERGAEVLALSRRRFARRIADEMGARGTLPLEDIEDAAADGVKWNGGREFDCVIEATGLQDPLTLGARLTRIRGRLVIAGYHQDGARQVDMQLWNWRGLDVINAHEREPEVYRAGMRKGVELAAAGRLNFGPLLTHVFPLAELGRALEISGERPDGFMKACVVN